jgi:type I restriction enzyme S subunit
MRCNYRRIGDFIELVDVRNRDLKVKKLLGLSISKQFIPSVANIVGTSMRGYKIIKKDQFACSIMQVRRDRKMPVALLKDYDQAIISQAYPVFEITKPEELLPDYLMMWFTRSEFDRHAEFLAVGGVRGSLEWEDFLDMTLPVPILEKQQEIVNDYNTVQDRIRINEALNTALEETAQALYKHWFVDFEFPVSLSQSELVEDDLKNENPDHSKGYKSSGGAMVYNEELNCEIPVRWEVVGFLDELNINGGGTPKTTNSDFWDGEIPFFTPKDVTKSFFTINTEKFLTQKGLDNCSSRLYKKHTIFITARGTVGAISLAGRDMAMNQSCYAFVDKDNLQFYGHQSARFAIDNLKRQAVGAVFSALVTKDFQSTMILKPSLLVKQMFNELLGSIYSNILNAQMENVKHRELSDLLLSKMTNVQDVNDLGN